MCFWCQAMRREVQVGANEEQPWILDSEHQPQPQGPYQPGRFPERKHTRAWRPLSVTGMSETKFSPKLMCYASTHFLETRANVISRKCSLLGTLNTICIYTNACVYGFFCISRQQLLTRSAQWWPVNGYGYPCGYHGEAWLSAMKYWMLNTPGTSQWAQW